MHISSSTIERLPKYLRVLRTFNQNNVSNISSTLIAKELGLNSIQVRKDLALISNLDGKPKVGFDVNELINDIESFFNLKIHQKSIIVGAGRLGQALMNYPSFDNNINIIAAFDIDKNKVDNNKIFYIDEMDKIIKKHKIKIAIITVPKSAAQSICDTLINYGIKVIWNFAPVDLKVPNDVKIRNEDLSASLAILLNGIE